MSEVEIEDSILELFVVPNGVEVVVNAVLLVVATSSAATSGTTINRVGGNAAMEERLATSSKMTMTTDLSDERWGDT